jgi:SAM-dependent methyltransferase
VSNEDQRKYWETGGQEWVRLRGHLDALLVPFDDALFAALAVQPGEAVLDVGCGYGTTALRMARGVAPSGRVVGVDLSPAMIDAAIARAGADGVTNVSFAVADAQTAALADIADGGPFDAVCSRFGTMFFDDPAVAFANIRRATRAGGRLASVSWQPPAKNPLMGVPTLAVASVFELPPPPPPGSPGPFAFADPARLREVVEGGGWSKVDIDGVDVTQVVAADNAPRSLLEIGPARSLFNAATEAEQEKAIEIVASAIEPFAANGQYEFPSSVFVVTAHA